MKHDEKLNVIPFGYHYKEKAISVSENADSEWGWQPQIEGSSALKASIGTTEGTGTPVSDSRRD